MQGCVYTAQGEMICDKREGVETFVQEKQNIPKSEIGNVNIDNAIKQNYCDISVEIDPSTGKTVYAFKKQCTN